MMANAMCRLLAAGVASWLATTAHAAELRVWAVDPLI